MMRGFLLIIARELRLAWTGGGIWLPVIFMLLVASLFPGRNVSVIAGQDSRK